MIVSVPLTLPGLVGTIDANIHVGVGTRLFDIALLLEVSIHSPFFSHPEMVLNTSGRTTVHAGIDRVLHAFETISRQ
jgi:hypothetical protein